MSDLISRKALCEYALNQKDKSITPNDIMRFPSAQPEVTEEAVKDYCRKRRLTILTNDYFHKLTSAQPEWDEMIVVCDCCGHAIHVKRMDVEKDGVTK